MYNHWVCVEAHTCCNSTLPCPVKASETLVEVSGDMLWMNNTVTSIGGAVYLTLHAQLRLHPSANLTFVSNNAA